MLNLSFKPNYLYNQSLIDSTSHKISGNSEKWAQGKPRYLIYNDTKQSKAANTHIWEADFFDEWIMMNYLND